MSLLITVSKKLIDHIHAVLPKMDMARFADGYLFSFPVLRRG